MEIDFKIRFAIEKAVDDYGYKGVGEMSNISHSLIRNYVGFVGSRGIAMKITSENYSRIYPVIKPWLPSEPKYYPREQLIAEHPMTTSTN